jgi:RNA polymerase sigma-70 factor (ECF subfamily)
MLGVARLDLAEDLVQESILAAAQAWKLGMPRDPEAWLFTVARNRARDALRRERVRSRIAESTGVPEIATDEELRDEQEDLLDLMFSCCSPSLSEETQAATVLRHVCGFNTREVAQAFLTDVSAMERRLARAKSSLAAEGRLFEVSRPEDVRARSAGVLSALYLMFDAGYHASMSPEPIRLEICHEAVRLVTHFAESRSTSSPESHALAALMLLHAARMPARLDDRGSLVPLEKQDRARWDRGAIARGMEHLSASAKGAVLSPYHLEAGIAAQHAMAPSYEATDWSRIVGLYDVLYDLRRNPVIALGRAVARAEIVGSGAAIDELLTIESIDRLESYPFYWAALGDLALRLGDKLRARTWLERGAETARNAAERDLFLRRLNECGD